MSAERSERDRSRSYRVLIEGRVNERWADLFEADSVSVQGPNTLLEVRVTDQAALYGRLRRIHDLNLRLISVTPVEENPTNDETARG